MHTIKPTLTFIPWTEGAALADPSVGLVHMLPPLRAQATQTFLPKEPRGLVDEETTCCSPKSGFFANPVHDEVQLPEPKVHPAGLHFVASEPAVAPLMSAWSGGTL